VVDAGAVAAEEDRNARLRTSNNNPTPKRNRVEALLLGENKRVELILFKDISLTIQVEDI
jgi:hypothetical protein